MWTPFNLINTGAPDIFMCWPDAASLKSRRHWIYVCDRRTFSLVALHIETVKMSTFLKFVLSRWYVWRLSWTCLVWVPWQPKPRIDCERQSSIISIWYLEKEPLLDRFNISDCSTHKVNSCNSSHLLTVQLFAPSLCPATVISFSALQTQWYVLCCYFASWTSKGKPAVAHNSIHE